MKRIPACLLLCLLPCFLYCEAHAQQSVSERRQEWLSALRALVDSELAFARAAAEKGTRDAFLEFLGEDSMLFRPQPVPGRKAFLERPATPGKLSWRPVYADVSTAGDLGYTTGPYEFRKDAADAIPASHGNYFTIWKKQPGGVWKVLIDYGTTNPAPAKPLPEFDPAASIYVDLPKAGAAGENETAALVDLEVRLSQLDATGGAAALKGYLADAVRFLRQDRQPAVGIDAVIDLLTSESGIAKWTPEKSGVSISGDLGFTYGKIERQFKGSAGGSAKSGYYLRVFRKMPREGWKIAAEVVNYQ